MTNLKEMFTNIKNLSPLLHIYINLCYYIYEPKSYAKYYANKL